MNFTEWILFFLFIQLLHFAGTWNLYVRAGRKAWEAAVPVYNAIVLAGIIKRPKWWVILLFFPIVNQLMFPVFWIETARSFGFNKRKDTILVLVTLGLYLFYINYATDAPYKKKRSLKPRTAFGEWVSAIAFAIIAATMVHTYVMQPYTIPSSSLEKSLLVGDYLFVSKFHYGARVPMTTVAVPMIHDSIPFTKKKSYLFSDDYENQESALKSKLQLPYMRVPGFEKIKRNETVVFNQPADTLLDMNVFTPDRNYYKPIDKKTNLVKRCIGVAGDSLEIRDGYAYINGKKNELPDRTELQFYYVFETKDPISSKNLPRFLEDNNERYRVFSIPTKNWEDAAIRSYLSNNAYLLEYKLGELNTEIVGFVGGNVAKQFEIVSVSNKRAINMTAEEAEKTRKLSYTVSVEQFVNNEHSDLFPQVPSLEWSSDNFGPIYIPEAGATVELNEESIPFYKRIISEYEGNDLEIIGDNYFINGEKATSYTFQQDYYWMMGDNRQNSIDARRWGYVPFDHVVGKPVFIWFSRDQETGRVRWERMFTTVSGEGERVSYLIYFLIAVGLYGLYTFVLKKRFKKAKK